MQNLADQYIRLKNIIKKRQAYELKKSSQSITNELATQNDWQNNEGDTLLILAIKAGDKDKVVEHIKDLSSDEFNSIVMKEALKLPTPDIAEFIFDSLKDLDSVKLADIKTPACRKWFQNKIEHDLQVKTKNQNGTLGYENLIGSGRMFQICKAYSCSLEKIV